MDQQVPALYVVMVDVSGSMARDNLYGRVKDAVTAFVGALDPADQVYVFAFDQTARPCGSGPLPAERRDEILRCLPPPPPTGADTNLGQALYEAVGVLEKSAEPVAALVLISDGEHDPADGSRYPRTGIATDPDWSDLEDRAAALTKVTAYAMELRASNGATTLGYVFPHPQILEAGSPELIRPLLDRPKADARAAKARLLLVPDLAKGASVQWPAGEPRLDYAAGRAEVNLTVTSEVGHLPVQLEDLRLESTGLPVKADGLPERLDLAACRDQPCPLRLRLSWAAPPGSPPPGGTLRLTGRVTSPFEAELREIDVPLDSPLTSAPVRFTVTAPAPESRAPAIAVAMVATLLLLGAALAAALWLRRNPALRGSLSASIVINDEGGTKDTGVAQLSGRRHRLALNLPGKGTVHLAQGWYVITYSPDGSELRTDTGRCPPGGSVIVNGVLFRHRLAEHDKERSGDSGLGVDEPVQSGQF
ncbi:hypothetical protein GCM10009555_058910 [Acrocarpospora macrocephala]|uniref:VWFA domain-containing protein n=1 Tax=Acrocarpospora macrocephala TaxID=150177 RepID=A0A5M3WSM8_9ACTN|nr:hypothetical protein Amac_054810 [Acrocarpospora macrocephala]